MFNVKETLVSLTGFVDNEYLVKYVRLVERNRSTQNRKGTNKHHIIPKSWFKLNSQPINNNLENLVTLSYRDHVLAHYFLCLCTDGKLQFANQLALICLSSRDKLNFVDKALIKGLPLYNNIYENYKERRKTNYQLYDDVLIDEEE